MKLKLFDNYYCQTLSREEKEQHIYPKEDSS